MPIRARKKPISAKGKAEPEEAKASRDGDTASDDAIWHGNQWQPSEETRKGLEEFMAWMDE